MTAELRYLVLSVYVIPAITIVTSLGSPVTSPPVESALPVSRMFLAYSSAAHEAPSLKPSMPGMVYLRFASQHSSSRTLGEGRRRRTIRLRGRWRRILPI